MSLISTYFIVLFCVMDCMCDKKLTISFWNWNDVKILFKAGNLQQLLKCYGGDDGGTFDSNFDWFKIIS